MTVKGTLIATLAAGYISTMAPLAATAGEEPGAAPKAEKASCKGKEGCKGHGEKKAAHGEKGSCKAAEGTKDKPAKEAAAAK